LKSFIPDIPYINKKNEKSDYVFLSLLTMMFIVVLIMFEITVYLMIDFFHYKLPISTFSCPFIFAIADLIAEVYGYRAVKKIIWNGLICQFIFGLFFTIIININFLNFSENIFAFKIVFHDILKTNIVSFLAITSGMFINAIIISKLKLNMNGKIYWIRTIISSSFSGFVVTFIGCALLYFEIKSYTEIFGTFMSVFLYGVIAAIFISPILAFIARKIKKIEEIDTYDYNINYNPFKI
jgi:queuosine precursor transporter